MSLKTLLPLIVFVFCFSVWPSGEYPKIIQNIIDRQSKDCVAQDHGQLTIASQAIQSLKFNKDQVKDYLVDESGFVCTSGQDMHAGSMATRLKLYLSEKKSWKMAWSAEVLSYKFDEKNSELVIEVYSEKDSTLVVKKVLKVEGAKVTLTSSPS